MLFFVLLGVRKRRKLGSGRRVGGEKRSRIRLFVVPFLLFGSAVYCVKFFEGF